MESHPLIESYTNYIKDKIDFRIAVCGQVDAGKSALIHALTNQALHISTETDATRDVKTFDYNEYVKLIDFPGVGTTEYSVKDYKKLLKKENIKRVFYVFSSKIHAEDEKVIQFLSKENIEVTFIYNKLDALVDITGNKNIEILQNDKNTELHATFKKYFSQPLEYHFVSVRENIGLSVLKEKIESFEAQKREQLNNQRISRKYIDRYINIRTTMLSHKLLSPSFKEILLNKEFASIEETTLEHFKISESDILSVQDHLPRVKQYIEEARLKRDEKIDVNSLTGRIVQIFTTVFKLRKLNIISFITSFVLESGIKTVYPVLKGTASYVADIKEITKQLIKQQLAE